VTKKVRKKRNNCLRKSCSSKFLFFFANLNILQNHIVRFQPTGSGKASKVPPGKTDLISPSYLKLTSQAEPSLLIKAHLTKHNFLA
jgi:hypothetical protein